MFYTAYLTLLLAGPLTSVRQQELCFARSVLPAPLPSLLQSAHPEEAEQAIMLPKLHCSPLPFLLILSRPLPPFPYRQGIARCGVLGMVHPAPPSLDLQQRMLGGHYFAVFIVLVSHCL